MIRRHGMTMIEMLTVIGIIGLISAIVIPAVITARSQARKAQCASHLKQIGIALQDYSSIHGCYPSALMADMDGGSRSYVSPYLHLLPMLGEEATYSYLNFDCIKYGGPEPQAQDTATRRTIGVFLCPSDSRHPDRTTGGVNYRFCLGPAVDSYRPGPPRLGITSDIPGAGEGPFVCYRWLRPEEFSDGLSNTIGMSEKLKGDGSEAVFDRRAEFWYTGVQGPYLATAPMIEMCASLSTSMPSHDSQAGGSWYYTGWRHTWYNHSVTPNSPVPDCTVGTEETEGGFITGGLGVFGARSNHAGGVNCLIMDGGVRFVSDSIALDLWRAYSTRAEADKVE